MTSTSIGALKQYSLSPKTTRDYQNKSQYIGWVDYAKGIGITLMVLGHVIRGLLRSNLLTENHWLLLLDQWIYAFHMPLFFFLSGLFAQSALRKSTQSLMMKRLQRIVYPYFLWSLLQGVLKLGLPKHANGTVIVDSLLGIVHTPLDQFWFLYVLFLLLTTHTVVNRLAMPNILFLGITSLLTMIYIGRISLGDWGVIYLLSRYIPVFALGVYIGEKRLSRLQDLSLICLLAIAGLTGTTMTIGVSLGLTENRFLSLLIAACGISLVSSIAMVLVRLECLSHLANLGKNSLEIYLAHVLIIAVGRILAIKIFGYTNIYFHLALGVILGIYIPLWLRGMCCKYNFDYLFTWSR
ncbi:MAG: acyltransferase [Spirulina sp. SIO3F2]|nr:acyltransferase [Spirulina sp. SIO3F2]